MANTYDTYKDSGIAWIGEIPSEWDIKRLGNFYNPRNEKVSDKDYAPLSVTMKGIVPQLETAAKTDDGDNRKLVREGDFVINSRSDRRGSCGISALDGSVSLINIVLCPKGKMDAGFYNWLFHTSMFADEYYKWGHGIVDDLWTTRWSEMKNICVVNPSLSDQQSIASFLDTKCGEIDALISLQEEMISELQAYKQSVITEAVTKGLNPHAKMKDSGVEWIGEIPEGWKVMKLKNFCVFLNGDRSLNYPQPNEYKSKGIPFLGADSLVGHYVDCNVARFISNEKYNSMGGLKIQIGDILYTLRGSTIGKNALCNFDEGTVASSLMGIRVNNKMVSYNFLSYWLNSAMEAIQKDALINGATAPNLSAQNVGGFIIFLPPLPEQHSIATYLDEKTSQIDSLIALKQQKIEELKDYKKSIIYEYVTGKKRV